MAKHEKAFKRGNVKIGKIQTGVQARKDISRGNIVRPYIVVRWIKYPIFYHFFYKTFPVFIISVNYVTVFVFFIRTSLISGEISFTIKKFPTKNILKNITPPPHHTQTLISYSIRCSPCFRNFHTQLSGVLFSQSSYIIKRRSRITRACNSCTARFIRQTLTVPLKIILPSYNRILYYDRAFFFHRRSTKMFSSSRPQYLATDRLRKKSTRPQSLNFISYTSRTVISVTCMHTRQKQTTDRRRNYHMNWKVPSQTHRCHWCFEIYFIFNWWT